MKKYLFGLSAIVLAIAFSAFTRPVKTNFDQYVFKYNGSTSLAGQVEDEDKWTFLRVEDSGEPQTNCGNSEEQACEIAILEADITASLPLTIGNRLDIVAPGVDVKEHTSILPKYAVDLAASINVFDDFDRTE